MHRLGQREYLKETPGSRSGIVYNGMVLAGESRAMPVPTSQQQPATKDGRRERALSNKDNQHAILAWTIYLLKSQRELSNNNVVMLQQTTQTRVLHMKVLSSECAFFGVTIHQRKQAKSRYCKYYGKRRALRYLYYYEFLDNRF